MNNGEYSPNNNPDCGKKLILYLFWFAFIKILHIEKQPKFKKLNMHCAQMFKCHNNYHVDTNSLTSVFCFELGAHLKIKITL